MQVHISVIFRIVEQKHSIIRSGTLGTSELSTLDDWVSVAGRQNPTFFWGFLEGLRDLSPFTYSMAADIDKVYLSDSVFCSLAVYAASDRSVIGPWSIVLYIVNFAHDVYR